MIHLRVDLPPFFCELSFNVPFRLLGVRKSLKFCTLESGRFCRGAEEKVSRGEAIHRNTNVGAFLLFEETFSFSHFLTFPFVNY